MPYVVSYKAPKGKEISLDQILSCEVDVNQSHKERLYPGTVTRCYDSLPAGLYTADNIQRLMDKLANLPFVLSDYKVDSRLYKHFQIPKRSGGKRDIYAPTDTLYAYQVMLRTLFEQEFDAQYHTSAFAYCKGRSILYCLKRHQANKSKWFLKLDFSDFFGNTSMPFVLSQLKMIAPFSEVLNDTKGSRLLSKALNICFLNGGLPQGTPISPMLTNLIMIPIDHELNKRLHDLGFVYTRYADDLQISHKETFDPESVIKIVSDVLRQFNAPYEIKKEKTRFGSSSGRNWNLGLMLNKDNRITLGHKKHKLMKARIYSFLMDEKNHHPWSLEEVQKLAGQVAYFKSIEPQTVQYITTQISHKVQMSFDKTLKKRLRNRPISRYGTIASRARVRRRPFATWEREIIGHWVGNDVFDF